METMMTIPAIGYGALVGLSLGLTGSGGSILAVPLMVYGLHMPMAGAVILSLAVVGFIAFTGAIRQSLSKQVDWVTAGLFAVTGMIVSPLVLHYTAGMNESLRLSLFAVLMLFASWRMQANTLSVPHSGAAGIDALYIGKAAASGIAAGALAGLFGIGGGFIIVPLLVIGLHLPFRRAVGTSLASIFLISLSGIAYGVLGETRTEWAIFIPFAAGGVAGMLAGAQLTAWLPERATKLVFSGVIALLAVWILFDNLWLKNGGAS